MTLGLLAVTVRGTQGGTSPSHLGRHSGGQWVGCVDTKGRRPSRQQAWERGPALPAAASATSVPGPGAPGQPRVGAGGCGVSVPAELDGRAG